MTSPDDVKTAELRSFLEQLTLPPLGNLPSEDTNVAATTEANTLIEERVSAIEAVIPLEPLTPAETVPPQPASFPWPLVGAGIACACILGIVVSTFMQHKTYVVSPGMLIGPTLALAHAGDTVVIRGTHRERLVIKQEITLRGESGATLILERDPVILILDAHGVTLENLNLINKGERGDEGAGVLMIQDAEVNVRNCYVEGGRNGVVARGTSRMDLLDSTVQDALVYGVVYFDRAKGLVKGSRAHHNENNGFGALNEADVQLEGNQAFQNGRAGIVFLGRSRGEARNNECWKNGRHGIVVDAFAAPRVVENRAHDNIGPGIGFYDYSKGEAYHNTLLRNGSGGLLIKEHASPTIGSNVEADNRPDTGQF